MKLQDIKAGVEYGVEGRRNRSATPRQVEVLDIVTVEEDYWAGGGSFATSRAKRKIRRVKIRCLGSPRIAPSRYSYGYPEDNVLAAEEGTEFVIEARLIKGRWADLHKGVQERIDRDDRIASAKRATEKRLIAILGKKKMEDVNGYVHVTEYALANGRKIHIDLRIEDKHLDTLLALAEKGVASGDR